MDFHQLSEQYPLMPAYELGRMEEVMRERGNDLRFPIIRHEGKILDGRNRWLAAKAAGVTPKFIDFHGTEEEARLFVGAAIVGLTATPIGLGEMYDTLTTAGTNSDFRKAGALVPCLHYGPDEPDLKHLGRINLGED